MYVTTEFSFPRLAAGQPPLQISTSDPDRTGIIMRAKIVPPTEGYRVTFEGLSFGVTVMDGATEIYSQTWPKQGVAYRASDQSVIAAARLDVDPGTALAFTAHLFDAAVGHYEAYATVTAPLPPSPGDSWTWVDGTGWTPPIPYPADYATVAYTWDEAQYTATGNGWATA